MTRPFATSGTTPNRPTVGLNIGTTKYVAFSVVVDQMYQTRSMVAETESHELASYW